MPLDNRKQSIYMAYDMLKEIKGEAKRLDRSMSWMMQQAWRISRRIIAQMPSAESHEAYRDMRVNVTDERI